MTSRINLRQNPRYEIFHKQIENPLNETIKNNKIIMERQHINRQTDRSRKKSQNSFKKYTKQLMQIPRISNPQMVVSIDFARNKIIAIPKYIQNLVQIKQINLTHNCICRIDNIFTLQKLQKLQLGYNKISQVPQQIIKLQKLQLLDLSFNNISYASQIQSLGKLISLRGLVNQFLQIYLQGNQVCQLNTQLIRTINNQQRQNNQFRIFNKLSEIQKPAQMNTNLQDLSSIILNSNKSELQVLKNQHILKKKTLDKEYKKQNNKQNYHNQKAAEKAQGNISTLLTKRLQNGLQQMKKLSGNKNNKKFNQKEEFELKADCINQSLLISPNFKQSSFFQTKQNMLTAKIKNDCQFKVLLQQNKQLLRSFGMLLQKFNLLKQLQNIPCIVNSLYIQNTELVLCNIQQAQLIFNFQKDGKYIFQQLSVLEFEKQIIDTLQKSELGNKKIQINHEVIVDSIAKDQTFQLHWYKTWLYQYSKFKQNNSLIVVNIFKIISVWKKYFRVSQILNINFQGAKQAELLNAYRQKAIETDLKIVIFQKSSDNKQSQFRLQKLLFSKEKKQFSKDSSIKKKSYPSSEKKNRNFRQVSNNFTAKYPNQCFQCLLKDQEVKNLKIQVVETNLLLEKKSDQNQKLIQQISIMRHNKELNQTIKCQQKRIIQQLDDIQPSTYQLILLEQAKAIESMFNYQNQTNRWVTNKISTDLSIKKKHQDFTVHTNNTDMTKINNTNQLYSQKDQKSTKSNSFYKLQTSKKVQEKTPKTSLNKGNNMQNQISQFVLPIDQQQQHIKRQSTINYFRNTDKNDGHSHLNSLIIQSKNKKPSPKREKLQSDDRNSNNEINRKKRIFKQKNQMQTQKKNMKYSTESHQKCPSKKQQGQGGLLYNKMADKSQRNTKNQAEKCQNNLANKRQKFAYQSFKTEQFVLKLINNQQNSRSQKQMKFLRKSNSESIQKQKEWPNKNNYKYMQLQLMEAKQYKKYIDYHLRNNIQQILCKKKQQFGIPVKNQSNNKSKHSNNNIATTKKATHSANRTSPIFIKKGV